jgi:predicted nucleotidyltransferase
MGISKRHLNPNTEAVSFSIEDLAKSLQEKFPEIIFAYLMGSAVYGIIKPHSDLDLAFYLEDRPDLRFYSEVQELCEKKIGNIRCDTAILNHAEPVYRFEALKGKLLFARDQETWLRFYSVTCRQYESQMFHYEKQLCYRTRNT